MARTRPLGSASDLRPKQSTAFAVLALKRFLQTPGFVAGILIGLWSPLIILSADGFRSARLALTASSGP
jgi:hypothetical protein